MASRCQCGTLVTLSLRLKGVLTQSLWQPGGVGILRPFRLSEKLFLKATTEVKRVLMSVYLVIYLFLRSRCRSLVNLLLRLIKLPREVLTQPL